MNAYTCRECRRALPSWAFTTHALRGSLERPARCTPCVARALPNMTHGLRGFVGDIESRIWHEWRTA